MALSESLKFILIPKTQISWGDIWNLFNPNKAKNPWISKAQTDNWLASGFDSFLPTQLTGTYEDSQSHCKKNFKCPCSSNCQVSTKLMAHLAGLTFPQWFTERDDFTLTFIFSQQCRWEEGKKANFFVVENPLVWQPWTRSIQFFLFILRNISSLLLL